MEREPVAVLGGGTWGATLAHLLALNHDHLRLWVGDRDFRRPASGRHDRGGANGTIPGSERVEETDDLALVARGADLLFIAEPSHVFRDVARKLGDLVEGDQILISCTKGLEAPGGARMSEVLLEETCVKRVGALGGPAYHEDLERGSVGAAVIGSRFDGVIGKVQTVLSSRRIRIFGNSDLMGVELGGALAKIFALLCGIIDGLELGASVKAVAVDRGLTEISRIGAAMGARAETFTGLSALGDMVAVAAGCSGRDHRLGLELARGVALEDALRSAGAPAECVPTTRTALELAERFNVSRIPLIKASAEVLFEGTPPGQVIEKLMTLKMRNEYE